MNETSPQPKEAKKYYLSSVTELLSQLDDVELTHLFESLVDHQNEKNENERYTNPPPPTDVYDATTLQEAPADLLDLLRSDTNRVKRINEDGWYEPDQIQKVLNSLSQPWVDKLLVAASLEVRRRKNIPRVEKNRLEELFKKLHLSPSQIILMIEYNLRYRGWGE